MIGFGVRLLTVGTIALVATSCSGAAGPSSTAGDQGVQRSPASARPSPSPSAAAAGRPVHPITSVQVGRLVGSIRAGKTGIWAITDGGVVRVDPTTNTVAASYPLPVTSDGYGLGVSDDAIWVSDFDHDVVYRMDPATGDRIATIKTRPGPGVISVIDGAVWVGEHHAGSISRIDPATNRIVATIMVGEYGPGGPTSIKSIDGSLWVGFGGQPVIDRVDAAAGKVTSTFTLPAENGVPFEPAKGRVWAFYTAENGGIAMLDQASGTVTGTIDLGGVPGYGGVVSDGVAWVPVLRHTAGKAGEVLAIDPATDVVVDHLSVADGTPDDLLVAFGSVWLELGLQGLIERVPPTTLTVAP